MDNDSKTKENIEKKHGHTLRNIFIIVLFLAIGIVAGIYGTKYYLDSREVDEPDVPNVSEGPEDITESQQTKELVNSLYLMLNKDPMFYTTKGIDVTKLANSTKLSFLYKYLIDNKQGKAETLSTPYYGSNVCDYDFLTDPSEETYSSTCTITKLSRNLFKETNRKIFNDDLLDTSVEFSPENGKKCVIDSNDDSSYICGNVTNESGITGALESKFTINKVTRDEDGTIIIYEKGYLVDKRSNVLNENSQYDNYYLHSSDSDNYYFELKNADNLTFKHTFKTEDRLNYYYAGTELVK